MNRERWLLLIAIVIFVGLGIYYLRPGKLALLTGKKTPSVAVGPSAQQAVPEGGTTAQKLAEATVQAEVVGENTPWGRNPFLTEAEEAMGKAPRKDGPDGLKVRAIIMGRPKSVATVDGRTVVVGEKVGEETVVEIRPDAVVLEIDGRKRTLSVSEPSVSIEVKDRKNESKKMH